MTWYRAVGESTRECNLERQVQIGILEAAMGQKISRLAQKYGVEPVEKAWEEMKKADRDRSFYKVFEWKSEMNLMEALEALDDYCDFLEAMIWKHQQKEHGKNHYPLALYQ